MEAPPSYDKATEAQHVQQNFGPMGSPSAPPQHQLIIAPNSYVTMPQQTMQPMMAMAPQVQPVYLQPVQAMPTAPPTPAINNVTNVTVVGGAAGNTRCQHFSQEEHYMICPLILMIIMVIEFFPIGLYYLCCLDRVSYTKCRSCGFQMVRSYVGIYVAFVILNIGYIAGAILLVALFASAGAASVAIANAHSNTNGY